MGILLCAGMPYVDAILEEPPKWGLLKEVLEEVRGLKQRVTYCCFPSAWQVLAIERIRTSVGPAEGSA